MIDYLLLLQLYKTFRCRVPAPHQHLLWLQVQQGAHGWRQGTIPGPGLVAEEVWARWQHLDTFEAGPRQEHLRGVACVTVGIMHCQGSTGQKVYLSERGVRRERWSGRRIRHGWHMCCLRLADLQPHRYDNRCGVHSGEVQANIVFTPFHLLGLHAAGPYICIVNQTPCKFSCDVLNRLV